MRYLITLLSLIIFSCSQANVEMPVKIVSLKDNILAYDEVLAKMEKYNIPLNDVVLLFNRIISSNQDNNGLRVKYDSLGNLTLFVNVDKLLVTNLDVDDE